MKSFLMLIGIFSVLQVLTVTAQARCGGENSARCLSPRVGERVQFVCVADLLTGRGPVLGNALSINVVSSGYGAPTVVEREYRNATVRIEAPLDRIARISITDKATGLTAFTEVHNSEGKANVSLLSRRAGARGISLSCGKPLDIER